MSLYLESLKRSRGALLATLKGLTETEINTMPVEGIWSIKDVLGHIVAWEFTLVGVLQALNTGSKLTPVIILDPESFNKEEARKRKERSLEAVLKEMDRVRQIIVNASGQLSEDQLNQILPAPWGGEGSVGHLLEGLAWHETEHTKTIQSWKAANRT
jgi:uncharacterized damage-inducible protein DinB